MKCSLYNQTEPVMSLFKAKGFFLKCIATFKFFLFPSHH